MDKRARQVRENEQKKDRARKETERKCDVWDTQVSDSVQLMPHDEEVKGLRKAIKTSEEIQSSFLRAEDRSRKRKADAAQAPPARRPVDIDDDIYDTDPEPEPEPEPEPLRQRRRIARVVSDGEDEDKHDMPQAPPAPADLPFVPLHPFVPVPPLGAAPEAIEREVAQVRAYYEAQAATAQAKAKFAIEEQARELSRMQALLRQQEQAVPPQPVEQPQPLFRAPSRNNSNMPIYERASRIRAEKIRERRHSITGIDGEGKELEQPQPPPHEGPL